MFKKIFLSILFSIVISACASNNSAKNQAPEIRIVDANGVYRPIERRVPVMNLQLQQQKNNQLVSQPFSTRPEPMGNITPQAMQQATQQPIYEEIPPVTESAIEEAQMMQNQLPGNYEFNQNFGPSSEPLIENNYLNQAQIQNSKTKTKYNFGGKNSATSNLAKSDIKINKAAAVITPVAVTPAVIDEPKTLGTIKRNKKLYKIAQDKTPQNVISQNESLNNAAQANSVSATSKGEFVQIGIYSSKDKANEILAKGQNISSGFVKEIKSGQSILYKVFLGPIDNQKQGSELLQKAKDQGFNGSFITKNR